MTDKNKIKYCVIRLRYLHEKKRRQYSKKHRETDLRTHAGEPFLMDEHTVLNLFCQKRFDPFSRMTAKELEKYLLRFYPAGLADVYREELVTHHYNNATPTSGISCLKRIKHI